MVEITGAYLFFLAIPAFLSYSWYKYRGLEYIIINYRWIFVVLFLMPISLIYDLFYYVRNWIVFKLNSAPHMHDERVRDVQNQASVLSLLHAWSRPFFHPFSSTPTRAVYRQLQNAAVLERSRNMIGFVFKAIFVGARRNILTHQHNKVVMYCE